MQTNPSSGTNKLDHYDINGGEELKMIASARKPFRGLSCSSNSRKNLEPKSDRAILSRRVCVKLKDDILNPGELNRQLMALKKHLKARNRLSDLIRIQKNDKMTSNFCKRDPNVSNREWRPRRGQQQDLEPVLQGTEGLTLPHSRGCGGL